MDESPNPVAVPAPEQCRKSPTIAGIPATMGDGNEWLIARGGLWKRLEAYRDVIFDEMTINGTVPIAHVRACAFLLLQQNYSLTDDQATALVVGTDPSAIADAVVEAVCSAVPPSRTFSNWARSALIAAGIRPSDVLPEDLPGVLAMLVATKRAVPADQWTDAGDAARTFAIFKGLAKPATQETE